MQIASEAPASYRTSAARPGFVDLITTAVRETLSRRQLIRYLVSADIKKKGADTLLGNVWWLLDPLIAMAVYTFVMGVIFERGQPDFPIYILAAVIPFKWFTQSLSDSVGAIVRNERLIKQIQFPKIVLPIAGSVSEIIGFAFGMVLLLGLTAIWNGGAHLSPMIAWIPVIALVQYILTLGLSFFISALTVFYRDVGIVIGHVLRLLFFLSPILWSFDAAAGRGASLEKALGTTGYTLLQVNPVAILLTSYRHVIYGTVTVDANGQTGWSPPVPPDLVLLGILLAISLVLLVLGTWFFKRLEPAFAKVL
jgi:lipopolysaccharide transport system permease protein/teichoic acid transport system permease protein